MGAGAKNLAALLVAWAKKEKKHTGRTSLPKLLSGGDELHVLSLTEKQYDGFKKLAQKKITYAPFLNTKTKDGNNAYFSGVLFIYLYLIPLAPCSSVICTSVSFLAFIT